MVRAITNLLNTLHVYRADRSFSKGFNGKISEISYMMVKHFFNSTSYNLGENMCKSSKY